VTSRTRIAVLIAAAACSSSSATNAPASQAPAASTAASPAAGSPAAGSPAAGAACAPADASATGTPAQIKDFSFPTGLSVTAGQAIAWTNGDSANHTVTFDDGSCNTPVNAGSTVVVTYTVPGTHAFHCSIHPNMTGTIEVK
jgi:plastocyanin